MDEDLSQVIGSQDSPTEGDPAPEDVGGETTGEQGTEGEGEAVEPEPEPTVVARIPRAPAAERPGVKLPDDLREAYREAGYSPEEIAFQEKMYSGMVTAARTEVMVDARQAAIQAATTVAQTEAVMGLPPGTLAEYSALLPDAEQAVDATLHGTLRGAQQSLMIAALQRADGVEDPKAKAQIMRRAADLIEGPPKRTRAASTTVLQPSQRATRPTSSAVAASTTHATTQRRDPIEAELAAQGYTASEISAMRGK
jgi:hypothetical protein